jgi:hypothetical protein
MSDNFVVYVINDAPKPFSVVKAYDINKVAQRMMDAQGVVYVREVYNACRPRIPGSEGQYAATLYDLVATNKLKHHAPQG